MIVALVAAAFGAGLIDAIAGGGGLVSLPALLAVGLPPTLALGTNKGQAVFGAVTSAASYAARGEIDRPRAVSGFVAGFIGSWIGARSVLAIPLGSLRVVVMVLLIGAAALALVRRNAPTRTRELSPGAARGATVAIAAVLGAYDGFFGPGTGTLLVMAFATVFGDSLVRASGNAKIVNLASNLAAVSLFASRGTVLWSLALPMAAANALGAATGAHLAMRRGERVVRMAVLVVVAAVVFKLGLDVRAGVGAPAPSLQAASR